jgi:hypothetical protein
MCTAMYTAELQGPATIITPNVRRNFDMHTSLVTWQLHITSSSRKVTQLLTSSTSTRKLQRENFNEKREQWFVFKTSMSCPLSVRRLRAIELQSILLSVHRPRYLATELPALCIIFLSRLSLLHPSILKDKGIRHPFPLEDPPFSTQRSSIQRPILTTFLGVSICMLFKSHQHAAQTCPDNPRAH